MLCKTQPVTVNGDLNTQNSRDNFLILVVLPFMLAGNGVTILQQDNVRPRTARATTQFLTANNVNVMEWPSMSRDRRCYQIFRPLSTSGTSLILGVCILALISLLILHSSTQRCFKTGTPPLNIGRRYIRSMRNRCGAVINSNGGHTRYGLNHPCVRNIENS